jgi:hypothetical protein
MTWPLQATRMGLILSPITTQICNEVPTGSVKSARHVTGAYAMTVAGEQALVSPLHIFDSSAKLLIRQR